ncbi:hypothetical protein CGCS363_v009625 [Colletotrichum siamense]|uniref:uncharacterized protein n=1 Tax=Colletotrichum siamense TaxID=690259 RepID=UPI0018733AF1|nr:uncharacterized protein CGCS363_v009625 [Colletotrichum siamense]KAF5495143.1 hypothetical protein CGCS363_v009625 [Colletotrichum siamense]
MASTKDSGLGQLGAMFELRFKHICTMHSKGETEAAEAKALELLAEPRLGRLHKAGMHMILATSETDFVHHSLEAVRLFGEALQEQDITEAQRASLEHWHAEAKKLSEEARSDQSAIDNEINEKLKSGMTMRQIQDAQLSEMYERLARIGEEEGASAETSTAAPSDQDAEL